MICHREDSLDKFFEALEQEREARKTDLLNNAEKEQNRLKWIKFQQIIERDWWPVINEYLRVLGKLWFGDEMRLKGSTFRKELIAIPAYIVAHKIYGPMAIFWVAQKTWEEREAPFTNREEIVKSKTELIKWGYRCRVTIKDDGQYHFQDDAHNAQIQFDVDEQVNQERFQDIFANVYYKYRHGSNKGKKSLKFLYSVCKHI